VEQLRGGTQKETELDKTGKKTAGDVVTLYRGRFWAGTEVAKKKKEQGENTERRPAGKRPC